ncbi:MAG: hypothetical protein M1299_01415 [Firmicutes bacterium]|nr:hypothetical protein [Bacillota bacterium]MCL5038483.1 hypothetical protein [Bacillota bacterium]
MAGQPAVPGPSSRAKMDVADGTSLAGDQETADKPGFEWPAQMELSVLRRAIFFLSVDV